MRSPTILASKTPATLERIAQRPAARYAIAVCAVAVPSVMALLLGREIEGGLYLTLLFAAILISGVIGGLGPGMLATVLAGAVGRWLPPEHLTLPELRVLVVEGILVSIVGGVLRSVARKAREHLERNLRLEQQILEIGDDERRRIGHDLHDGLGQHLTGISLLTESMAQQMAGGRTPDPNGVETITQLVSQAVQITRDLARSLSPVTLERDGLVAAIEELAGTSSNVLGINCTCGIEDETLTLDRVRSLHVYRIVQEAVNNSVKHGKARNVRIELQRDGQTLNVTVQDDGSGLSQKTMANPGLGLRIMQYRARMLGATLAIDRASTEGGTLVEFSCSLNGQSGG